MMKINRTIGVLAMSNLSTSYCHFQTKEAAYLHPSRDEAWPLDKPRVEKPCGSMSSASNNPVTGSQAKYVVRGISSHL